MRRRSQQVAGNRRWGDHLASIKHYILLGLLLYTSLLMTMNELLLPSLNRDP